MRTYLNSRCGHNEISYARVTPPSDMLGFSNGIGLKLAKDIDFLKRCPPVVSRNWVHSTWTSGVKLDSNGCETTTNDFILLGNAGVNCVDNSLYYGNEKDEFAIWSTAYPERTVPGTSGVSIYRLKYRILDVDGTPSASAVTQRLVTSFRTDATTTAGVYSSGYVNRNYSINALALAPVCTVY